MNKRLKIYFSIFIAMFAIIVFMEANKKKPINWFPSYAAKDKSLYGGFILAKEFKTLFNTTEIQTIKKPPYQFLKDTTKTGTYFFVNGILNFGEEEFDELLKFVARGNAVFMSTNGANIVKLNLETKQLATNVFKEQSYYKLLNKNLDTTTYSFDKKSSNMVFSKIDTLKTIALGKLIIKNSEEEQEAEGINFIKYKHGKGQFYFHTFPLAFTNYGLLKDTNHQYIASVLSYIDVNKPIFYDAYYNRARRVRTLIKKDFEDVFAQGVDAILTPATPSAAFGLGEMTDADPVQMYLNDVFTVTVNLAGLPGISVPAGLDVQGLPLGLQLIGRPWEEGDLLNTAVALESAAGFVAKPGRWW